jgi:hypothetical protein
MFDKLFSLLRLFFFLPIVRLMPDSDKDTKKKIIFCKKNYAQSSEYHMQKSLQNTPSGFDS